MGLHSSMRRYFVGTDRGTDRGVACLQKCTSQVERSDRLGSTTRSLTSTHATPPAADGKSHIKKNGCSDMDAPISKPPCVADPPKPITVNRFFSSRTTSKCTPATTASPKLEELKLAFCLLAREIQGSDGEENEIGASSCTPAATKIPGGDGKAGGQVSTTSGTRTDSAAAAAAAAATPVASAAPTAAAAAVAVAGAATVQLSAPSSCLLPGVPEVSVPAHKIAGTVNAASSIAVHPETENPLPTTKAQLVSHHCCDTGDLERMQAAPRAVGCNHATEGAARGANQVLKRLQAELEAERRSRTAAERWVMLAVETRIRFSGWTPCYRVELCVYHS